MHKNKIFFVFEMKVCLKKIGFFWRVVIQTVFRIQKVEDDEQWSNDNSFDILFLVFVLVKTTLFCTKTNCFYIRRDLTKIQFSLFIFCFFLFASLIDSKLLISCDFTLVKLKYQPWSLVSFHFDHCFWIYVNWSSIDH